MHFYMPTKLLFVAELFSTLTSEADPIFIALMPVEKMPMPI
jgi:hypothetical protein